MREEIRMYFIGFLVQLIFALVLLVNIKTTYFAIMNMIYHFLWIDKTKRSRLNQLGCVW